MIQTFSKYLKGIEDAIDKVLTELNTKKNEQGDELTKVDKLVKLLTSSRILELTKDQVCHRHLWGRLLCGLSC